MAYLRISTTMLAGLLLAVPAASPGAQAPGPGAAPPDWREAIANALGRRGDDRPEDVYRVSLPRTDLKVTVDGIPIRPAFALGSWLAFHPRGSGVEVMGDLVLLEREIGPVMRRLAQDGLHATALHNHLLRAEPPTMYLHVAGQGEPAQLAAALRRALQETATPLQGVPSGSASSALDNDIDAGAIAQALGRQGTSAGGVYQVSVPRTERISEHGAAVPQAMGLPSVLNFEAAGNGNVATTGDLVLAADEVVPVQRALTQNGIEVTAIHSHMLHEEPRLFFMHFWGVGEPRQVAQGLRAALDLTRSEGATRSPSARQ